MWTKKHCICKNNVDDTMIFCVQLEDLCWGATCKCPRYNPINMSNFCLGTSPKASFIVQKQNATTNFSGMVHIYCLLCVFARLWRQERRLQNTFPGLGKLTVQQKLETSITCLDTGFSRLVFSRISLQKPLGKMGILWPSGGTQNLPVTRHWRTLGPIFSGLGGCHLSMAITYTRDWSSFEKFLLFQTKNRFIVFFILWNGYVLVVNHFDNSP